MEKRYRTITAQYLVGRRFEWRPVSVRQGTGSRALPDITFVSADPEKRTATAHDTNGGRWVFGLGDVVEAVHEGVLVESELGVPFVNDPPFTHSTTGRVQR